MSQTRELCDSVKKLNKAIKSNQQDKIDELLKGFNAETINAYDENNKTNAVRPIDVAIEFGTPETVEKICQLKPRLNEPNKTDAFDGYYPLHFVMLREFKKNEYEQGYAECKKIISILKEYGADFTKQYKGQKNLYHLAIKENKIGLFEELVNNKCPGLNDFDAELKTPLARAMEKDKAYEEYIQNLGGKLYTEETMALYNSMNKGVNNRSLGGLKITLDSLSPAQEFDFINRGLHVERHGSTMTISNNRSMSRSVSVNNNTETEKETEEKIETVNNPEEKTFTTTVSSSLSELSVTKSFTPNTSKENPLINSLVKAISQSSNVTFNLLFKQLQTKENKQEIAAEAIKRCDEKKPLMNDEMRKRIAALQETVISEIKSPSLTN